MFNYYWKDKVFFIPNVLWSEGYSFLIVCWRPNSQGYDGRCKTLVDDWLSGRSLLHLRRYIGTPRGPCLLIRSWEVTTTHMCEENHAQVSLACCKGPRSKVHRHTNSPLSNAPLPHFRNTQTGQKHGAVEMAVLHARSITEICVIFSLGWAMPIRDVNANEMGDWCG